MRSLRRVVPILSIIVVVFGSLLAKGESQADFDVSGEVLDKANKPIGAVLVQVERGSEVREARTDPNGKYIVAFKAGSPITTVKYQHSDWTTGTVADLSGQRSHRINKTMYPRGSQLALLEAQEALSSLERIYYADVFIKKEPIDKVRGAYAGYLKDMKVPPELKSRLDEVVKLYGV